MAMEENQTKKDNDESGRFYFFKEDSRAEQVRKSGLYVTCTNNTHCTFLRQPNYPVLQCDELG